MIQRASPDVSLPVVGGNDPPGAGACHSQGERAGAKASANAEVLERLQLDYPTGPHDQPQSMCPAFGSLRVGLRMRRTGTILSGSACCVYGLTFTSHFYGARRTVGYVPFNSESLVTGRLFEDIVEAVHEMADPEHYDVIVVTNLCVPTASGVPLHRLPAEINGVRIVGIDVPGFGVPTHAEAKDVLAGALLEFARKEAEAGPVARPRGLVDDRPRVTLLGEMFPADPIGIDRLLQPMGLAAGTVVPPREWRELYSALDCAVAAAVHPFYVASVRALTAAGRPVVGSGPVGAEGTAAWLKSVGDAAGVPADTVGAAVDGAVGAIRGALTATTLKGRLSISGYEGSELLVARVLVEAGAEVGYVGSAVPRTAWNEDDAQWLAARGVHVQFRASVEKDIAAFQELDPDLVIGTTPVVQKAKEDGIPALYFTNLISARPIFGPAGAGSLAGVIGTAIEGRERLGRMKKFFAGVGTGHARGYGWDGVPEKHLSAAERHAAARSRKGGAAKGTDAAEASTGKATRDPTTDTKSRAARSAAAKGSFSRKKASAAMDSPAEAESDAATATAPAGGGA